MHIIVRARDTCRRRIVPASRRILFHSFFFIGCEKSDGRLLCVVFLARFLLPSIRCKVYEKEICSDVERLTKTKGK